MRTLREVFVEHEVSIPRIYIVPFAVLRVDYRVWHFAPLAVLLPRIGPEVPRPDD